MPKLSHLKQKSPKLQNDPLGVVLAIYFGHQDPQNGALGDTLGTQDPQNGALGVSFGGHDGALRDHFGGKDGGLGGYWGDLRPDIHFCLILANLLSHLLSQNGINNC